MSAPGSLGLRGPATDSAAGPVHHGVPFHAVSAPGSLGLRGPATGGAEPAAAPPAPYVPFARVAQRRSRRRRRMRWALAVAGGLGLASAFAGDRGLQAWLTAGRTHAALVATIEDVRRENAALREQVRRLRDDPREIESIARRELGLMRPGERVFVVKGAPRPTSTDP